VADTARRLAARSTHFGLSLPSSLADKLVVFYDLLERWNRKINLSSLVKPDEAIDRLLLEPVAAAAELPRTPRMMDLGSGGGSPAIPLALSLGSPLLVMVESRSRKAAFLREAARQLGLTAVVENTRFEELGYQDEMELVSIRAVRTDEATLTLAGRFLKPGGTLALFRTAGAEPPDRMPGSLKWRKGVPLLHRAQLQLLDRV
jgi:16S rRNA (guanine527-N7)-methyltransferase